MDHLLKAKVIYEKIAEFKPALEALIYAEKISQTEERPAQQVV